MAGSARDGAVSPRSFAETVGPAAQLWHELALTCWFICEGPYSRTDIGGAPEYYAVQIRELEELGCPIDFGRFRALREAEKKLTPRAPGSETVSEHEVAAGISISVSFSMGPEKKDGFEYLNTELTRFRRTWMEQYLDTYLERRWEIELRRVGDAYHRHVADKGKPQTAKQFAKMAAPAANHSFAGDLAGLSAALGLPASQPQTRHRLMPHDRPAFIETVRQRLGGARWTGVIDHKEREERTRQLRRSELAERAPEVVQVWEATGERPALKGFGWARHRLEEAFSPDRGSRVAPLCRRDGKRPSGDAARGSSYRRASAYHPDHYVPTSERAARSCPERASA